MRQDAIDRATAEFSARLDGKQRLLAGEGSAPDLSDLIAETRRASGKVWTDYVSLTNVSHKQPLPWRLLDGAKCKVTGSERDWIARLIPVGTDQIVPRGFELLLVAEQPLPQAGDDKAGQDTESRLVGDALAPALREPVARIVANADKIRGRLAGPLRQEYVEYAGDIAAASRHLANLLDDLHDLETVESSDFSVMSQQLNLFDCASQAIKMMQAKAEAKSIALIGPANDAGTTGRGDARRVLQILLNLIGNAINYSPESSVVSVTITADKPRTGSIHVVDEGPGLSSEQRARVFAKFERLGRSGDGGSGLGLYISRRLADAMGGSLDVASEAGKGARFSLSLPAGEVAKSAEG